MQPAVLIRLRPLGPWRFGPGEGGQHQVDTVFRSDRLFSAVTLAAQSLGFLEEWLDATARADVPALVFSSLFPFQGDTLFAPPPASVWPPASASVTSSSPVFLSKMRWTAARFIPITAIETLLSGQPLLADQWTVDAESSCLLRRDRPSQSPFRATTRTRAAIDRVSGAAAALSSSACVEFESSAGLWLVVRFRHAAAESAWRDRLQACFRLLADTGLGGGRSAGWGQTAAPEFRAGQWPALLLPNLERLVRSQGNAAAEDESGLSLFWLLSLYSPAPSDTVDWNEGHYSLVVRGGRTHTSPSVPSGVLKKNVRMVAEGSVLSARREPVGAAVDVAPAEGVGHPVYRSGFSLVLKLPLWQKLAESAAPVETTPPDSPLEAQKEEEASSAAEPSALQPEPPVEPEAEIDLAAPVLPELHESDEVTTTPEEETSPVVPETPEEPLLAPPDEPSSTPTASETLEEPLVAPLEETPVPVVPPVEPTPASSEPASETPQNESERPDHEI